MRNPNRQPAVHPPPPGPGTPPCTNPRKVSPGDRGRPIPASPGDTPSGIYSRGPDTLEPSPPVHSQPLRRSAISPLPTSRPVPGPPKSAAAMASVKAVAVALLALVLVAALATPAAAAGGRALLDYGYDYCYSHRDDYHQRDCGAPAPRPPLVLASPPSQRRAGSCRLSTAKPGPDARVSAPGKAD